MVEVTNKLPVVEGVNSEFFKDGVDTGYGSPFDPESWLSRSQLLLVRHAESEENAFHARTGNSCKDKTMTDDVIYNLLQDCHLTDKGIEQARLLQSVANILKFADDVVYVSPHRRTIETLCYMLETYPDRGNLTVKLLPLAKEVLSSYGNVPIKVAQLCKEC